LSFSHPIKPDQFGQRIVAVRIAVDVFAVAETGASPPAVVGIRAGITHQPFEPVALLRQGQGPAAVNPDLIVSGRGLNDHSPRFPGPVPAVVVRDLRPGEIICQQIARWLRRLHEDMPAIGVLGSQITDILDGGRYDPAPFFHIQNGQAPMVLEVSSEFLEDLFHVIRKAPWKPTARVRR